MSIRNNLKAAFVTGVILLLSLHLSPSLVAQNTITGVPTKPHNCEDALAILDMTLMEGRKHTESSFIVIARLGDGERSQKLNQRRLAEIMSYFRNKGESNVVPASGGRANGLGRVELYVGGTLLHVLVFPKNRLIDCSGL